MRSGLLKFVPFFIALLLSCNSGQSVQKEVVTHVWGNCEKCKATIEKSALIGGVTKADWNIDSKLLSLKFDTTITSLTDILQSVAKAGYDNDRFFGNDYAYAALPECCQYDRRPQTDIK